MRRLCLPIVAWVALLSGCAANLPYVWVNELPPQDKVERLRSGDTLSVQVKDQKQLSGNFPVRDNGTYLQPLVGDIPVEGLTPREASVQLAKLLKGIVVEPLVAITISKRRPIDVPVLGEVRQGGVIQVTAGSTLIRLMAQVGGLNEFASKTGIYVLRRTPRLVRIRFDYDALVGGERRHMEFEIQEGDVVIVR